MKNNAIRWMAGAVMAVVLTAGSMAWAGQCCTKTAAATKDGKTCAACQTKECCKAAAKSEGAKPCEKCAAKAAAAAKEKA